MALDTEKLTSDIKAAIAIAIRKDVAFVDSLDTKPLKKIVRQAANTAFAIKHSRITGETRDFLLSTLRQTMTESAHSIPGIDESMAHRATQALSVVVFKAISDATGTEIKL